MIFEAEWLDGGECARFQVEHGDGVRFLQGDVSRIAAHGDVFGLEVVCSGQGIAAFVRVEHDALRSKLPGVEVGKARDAHGVLLRLRIDDGDRTCGIDGVRAVAHARLALVGGENVSAVCGKDDHVGLYARLIYGGDLVVVVEEGDAPRFGIVGVLQRDGDAVVDRIHRDARHIAVDERGVFLPHERGDVQLFRLAEGTVLTDVKDVEDGRGAVDDVRLLVVGIVGDDLRDAAVRIGVAQTDAVLFDDAERGVRFKAVFFHDVTLLAGDGLALAVCNGLVLGRHFGVVEGGGVRRVVVGVGMVFAAHRLFLGLDVRIAALIGGRGLRILGVVALHSEQIDVARGTVFFRHRIRKAVEFRSLGEQRDRDALVVQPDIPLHVALGDEQRRVGEDIHLSAADEETLSRADDAFEGEFLPCVVVRSVGRGLVIEVPAAEGDVRVRRVVQLDEAVADGFRIVRSAEHLVDEDVLCGDVVAAVRRIGGAVLALRARRHGRECRNDERTAERGGEEVRCCLVHVLFSFL